MYHRKVNEHLDEMEPKGFNNIHSVILNVALASCYIRACGKVSHTAEEHDGTTAAIKVMLFG